MRTITTMVTLAALCALAQAANCPPGSTFNITKLEVVDSNSSTRKSTSCLHMVRTNGVTRSASITATINGTPASGYPTWSGTGISGTAGSMSASFSGQGDSTVACTAENNDGCSANSSLQIKIIPSTETSFSFGIDTSKMVSLLDLLNSKVSFGPNARFTASSSITPSIKRWEVDKPDSPDYTYSYGGSLALTGKLTGRVSHPTFSGEFPPSWVPGDPWALWEVFAEANVNAGGNVSLAYNNDVKPANLSFSGSGSAGVGVKAGVYAVAQIAGYTGEGAADVSADAGANFRVNGTAPNQELQMRWYLNPVTLNASLKLVRDRDDKVIADHSFSKQFWETLTTDWSPIVKQPANPS